MNGKADFGKASPVEAQVPRRLLEVFQERGLRFLTASELKAARTALDRHTELEAIAGRWDPTKAKEASRKFRNEFHADFDPKKLESSRDALWDSEHGGVMRRQAMQAVTSHFCDKLASLCIKALEAELAAVVTLAGEISERQERECAAIGVHFNGATGDAFAGLVLYSQMLRARIESVKQAVKMRFVPEPPQSLLKTAFSAK